MGGVIELRVGLVLSRWGWRWNLGVCDLALGSLSGPELGLQLGPLRLPDLSLRPNVHPAHCHRVRGAIGYWNPNTGCSCRNGRGAMGGFCFRGPEVVVERRGGAGGGGRGVDNAVIQWFEVAPLLFC